MHCKEIFYQALRDYILLLNKKYPEKTVLEMVATRYGLNHFERSMLYRGIAKNDVAQRRREKLVTIEQVNTGTPELWNHGTLHIDLFNVLYTLAAYLRGFPVYLSNDGLLRDASESHGSGDWEVHLDKSLDLLMEWLEELKIEKAIIYIDNPLEYGLAISEKLRELAKSTKPAIEIIKDPSPDQLIRAATDGIIATSDSTIIDKSDLQVFDLPAFCLNHAFNPDFIAL